MPNIRSASSHSINPLARVRLVSRRGSRFVEPVITPPMRPIRRTSPSRHLGAIEIVHRLTDGRAKSGRTQRRILRRAVRSRCQAVGMEGFRLLGERVLDLSPYGMMVAADAEAHTGESVLISFEVPGERKWLDAEATVARVIEGWRPFDPGYAIGLRFTDISLDARLLLRDRLHGLPPPVPTRALRA